MIHGNEPWSTYEIYDLRKWHRIVPTEEIANRLNRSVLAVKLKMSYLFGSGANKPFVRDHGGPWL